MGEARLSDLFRAIGFVGTVKAVRQDYQVFRTVGGDFLVFSPSNRGSMAYHMTQVTAVRVEALRKITAKESVTSGSLMKDQRVVGAFGEGEKIALRFDLLMALYVLTALGEVEMGRTGRNLVFKPAK